MTISYPFLDNIPSMQIHPIHIVAFVWMKEQQRVVPLVQHDLHGSETRKLNLSIQIFLPSWEKRTDRKES